MSAPRQQKSSYHQKALQQIRNSLQPFATSESGSTSSGVSSQSSSNNDYGKEYSRPPQSSSPSRHSPRGIEYRAQQYPFVPSQVPPSVQQLLRRIDSPSSPSSSSSNSPTSQLTPIVKKPTLIIKSTVVPKPVLQTAVPYSLPPPLPPKPKPKLPYPSDEPSSVSTFSQAHVQGQVQPSSQGLGQGQGRFENSAHGHGHGQSNGTHASSAVNANVSLPPPPLPLHKSKSNSNPNSNSNLNGNANNKNFVNNNNNHYYTNYNNNDVVSSSLSSSQQQQPQPQVAQPQIPRARTPPSPRMYAFDYPQPPYHQFPNPNSNSSSQLHQSHQQQILPHLLHQQQQQQQYPFQIPQPPSTNPGSGSGLPSSNSTNNTHQPPQAHHQQPHQSQYNYYHSQQQQQQQQQPQHHQLPLPQPILQTKAFLDSETNVNVNSVNSVSNSNARNGSHSTAVDQKNPPEVTTHESPIPERKKLSREKEEERFESKVRVYSPQAFKFFMEQHVENVIKSHKERVNRRLQLEAEMAKIGLSEEAQTQMRRMLSQKESNYIRLKRAKMDKSMFKCIRTIGVGAFGEVTLVRKLDTQHLYAMKTLRKSDVLRRNQVAHVKAERDILAEADNEWVVKLYYSFQDMDHLYFVMDYIPGGDLMSLLIKKGIFEESLAQFYIAELTCAVESVHKMGFIHRDIKPDNILIDRDGHIKLTDFGLCTGFRWTHNSKYYQDSNGCHCEQNCQWQTCPGDSKPLEIRRKKEHIRCLAHSLVGTPNYIAPEVLMRTGYTQLCDWWSVGVILYEMLVGQPPFLAPTPAETQYKVINWATTLRIPSQAHLSSQAKDLILKLCTDHTRRLGKNGPQQVKSHPFFIPIDFQSGLRRTVAPFVPKIRHPTDTSNFDPCDGDKPEDPDSSPLDSNQFHGFFEFTFRRFFDDAYNNEDGGPVYV